MAMARSRGRAPEIGRRGSSRALTVERARERRELRLDARVHAARLGLDDGVAAGERRGPRAPRARARARASRRAGPRRRGSPPRRPGSPAAPPRAGRARRASARAARSATAAGSWASSRPMIVRATSIASRGDLALGQRQAPVARGGGRHERGGGPREPLAAPLLLRLCAGDARGPPPPPRGCRRASSSAAAIRPRARALRVERRGLDASAAGRRRPLHDLRHLLPPRL